MDKEQAIEVLKPLANSYIDYANITMKEEDDDIAEALEIAVDALKTQLSYEGTTKGATSDLISRQAAIDAVMEYGAIWMEYTDAMDKGEIAQRALNNAKSTMIRILKELPTIQPETPCYLGSPCEYQNPNVVISQPEPQEGHWIRRDCGLDVECKCSACGYKDFVSPHDTYWFKRNYCPNCGADMRGEQHETD